MIAIVLAALVVIPPPLEPSAEPDAIIAHRYKGPRSICNDEQARACMAAAVADAMRQGHYLVVRSVTCDSGPELSRGPVTYCDWTTFDPEKQRVRPSVPAPVTTP